MRLLPQAAGLTKVCCQFLFVTTLMKPKVIAYATFAGDRHYHLTGAAGGYNRTLCSLSTKGSLKNIRQYRPPARVTMESLPSGYTPCPLCQAELAKQDQPLRVASLLL
jgi:hypothetical protein